MKTYRILAPHFTAGIEVSGDVVLQAAPILGWTVGKSFISFRDYAKARGWSLEPLDDRQRPQWIELEGRVYEIRWSGNTIIRISLHENEEVTDIKFDDLPDIIKRMI